MNVLWLASWYPNKTSPFDGDFIERHAKAVSRLMPLTVLFVTKDISMKRGTFFVEKTVDENLTVYRGYYGYSSLNKIIEKAVSFARYKKIQRKIYETVVSEKGKPDLIHVHVAMKAGLLALNLHKKQNIPFIVTEHWTGYFKNNQPNVYSGAYLRNRLNKKILQSAKLLLAVSDNLGKTINNDFITIPYAVINNVVDTSAFFYADRAASRFRFIHPSVLNWQKNPEGILEACKIVKAKGYDFEVVFAGAENEQLAAEAVQAGLKDATIFFRGVITYKEVANEMQQANSLLLFSRNENMPCVILEALCCGLPVIATNVGGIPEVINRQNGILVESENVQQLVSAMISVMENYSNYNRQEIATAARQKFNYDVAAKQHIELYQKLLTDQQV